MIRAILGVVIGYFLWSAIWVGGTKLFFAEAQKTVAEGKLFDQMLPLIGLIVLSAVASLISGALCALIARKASRGPAFVLGLALLGTGIAVQASVWKLEPLWYHLTFLALLVPITILGANFIKSPAKASIQGLDR